jgi:hypothetical protein
VCDILDSYIRLLKASSYLRKRLSKEGVKKFNGVARKGRNKTSLRSTIN